MSNMSAGQESEDVAADHLSGLGYEIIDRNWRNRWCEIDIVARKQGRIYFVEVKSRHSPDQGDSLDYVTKKKLKQMALAAEIWVSSHGWAGEYQLSAIGVDAGEVTFVENAY